jgi:pimeloyl-ACP methyl ester carboxylesterase
MRAPVKLRSPAMRNPWPEFMLAPHPGGEEPLFWGGLADTNCEGGNQLTSGFPNVEVHSLKVADGVWLEVLAQGPKNAPGLLFLHGFPEGAFIWEPMLRRFASRYRCVAPNLRGFAGSSAPAGVDAYRARHLVADVAALVEQIGAPLDALVAHDWGGAVAWSFAARHPDALERLVIVNSPHPATFLRELQHNPAQQAASAYMRFLCRPDAEALLAENDFARMWPFFTNMGAAGGWLTDEVKERYRQVWRQGLTGGCNYYRASPLKPPTADDRSLMELRLPAEAVSVGVPTTVIWAERDTALLPSLLDGLEAFVPRLRIRRVPDATHWIVHEQPGLVGDEIERSLRDGR